MNMTKELKKELFLEAMNAIKRQMQLNEQIDNALYVICDGYPVFTATADLETSYIKVIARLFSHPDTVIDDIYWLLYDGGGEVTINDEKTIMVKTPEELFEMIYEGEENEETE